MPSKRPATRSKRPALSGPRPADRRRAARGDSAEAAGRAARTTAGVLDAIGRNIRSLRLSRGLTLKGLADRTALSPSMLSLLERGRAAPSLGTMVVVAAALDVRMSDLLDSRPAQENEPVSRAADQPVFESPEGASRRVLKRDRTRGVEIAMNDYPPGVSIAADPRGPGGFEFGIAVEGRIEVTVDGRTYALQEGDVISCRPSQPHRTANPGRRRARALWLNLKKD